MPGKKPTHTGRDATKEATGIKHEISIHAPHTGRDSGRCIAIASPMNFNPRAPYGARPLGRYYNGVISIHAPHTGRDYRAASCSRVASVFQSTRPIRGATAQSRLTRRHRPHFNPRAPCGARLKINIMLAVAQDISIHAPHAGRDLAGSSVPPRVHHFNPRAPCGARPIRVILRFRRPEFQSTRPMRGATLRAGRAGGAVPDFNPRAPCGARLILHLLMISQNPFQSTRPMRGATVIVAPGLLVVSDFNPRAPYGARPDISTLNGRTMLFQSTRPIRGATTSVLLRPAAVVISIHAPHTGRDPAPGWRPPLRSYFNPRAPYGARHAAAGRGCVPL